MCSARKPDTEAACNYVAGYNECAAQVTQYLTSLRSDNTEAADANRDSLTDNARCCLLDHLADALHQQPQPTVDQSSSSSADYVISPQQVPVTSSTSPAQLRVLPATLSNGQVVLLLADNQHLPQRHGGKLDDCDVTTDTVSGCSDDEGLRECIPERLDLNSESESSHAARDHQHSSYDLHMWRPW